MIVVNFKKSKKAVKLAKICSKYKVIIAVLPIDISKVKGKIYSQFISSKSGAKEIKQKGAKGVLLNHSDNPISNAKIKKYIVDCRKAKLKTIVCCSTTKRAMQIDKMNPDYIAIEPKALIGGKISVSTAKPELIRNTVKAVKTKVLCGAGIGSKKDVKRALELGAKGVLVSSAVVKAKNPGKILKELAKGLNKR